ncbi:MAG: thiol protease/hemagglutinin PrtT [Bacteroidales bacterium]|nr:thiol protease/hemagglutinin PrtT [Bacteroidales bacterium]
MKKLLVIIAAIAFMAGQVSANPVDVNTAKNLGVKYLKNNVLSAKNIADAEHVYTLSSEDNTPYLYVFNHENGYVVVAADDRAYPILGYSDGEAFDVNNIPEGIRYFLGHYGRQIQYAIDNELVAEADVVEQWNLLEKEGVTMKTRMDRAVNPLLATVWDQGWPYNYYAPACQSYWTNNHCYAGCVATAMSQVMKFWNWPETGVGEHSYSSSSYGGTLSANFGNTTYDWSIMPNTVSSANAGGLAVALLMYHCGIAVDMDYAPDGSGAHTEDVAPALIDYFRYGACANVKSRDSYTKTQWEDMLIAQLDRGIPFVYAGSDTDGGHAFNCDGYNDQRKFHFNWGWSGQYNNTYYAIDALNTGNGHFNSYQRAVFDIMPDYIYDAMVPAIETLTVSVDDAMTKTVNIAFVVPTTSESGATLTSIEKIYLKRNGETIQTYNNPQPGNTITYDDNVSTYGAYEYTLVGENGGFEGKSFSQVVIVGPNCTWKFVCQTTNFQGWNDGKLQAVSANGTVFKELTMTSSSPLSEKVQFPEGNFTLMWKAPATQVSSITITLKDSAGQTAFTVTGSSTQLNSTLYTGNNDCPNCTAPTNFAGGYESGTGVVLTWNCDYSPSKFKIYRSENGEDYTEVGEADGSANQYVQVVGGGTYYYKVTAYSSACESTPAVTSNNADFVVVTAPLAVAENNVNARIYPNPTTGNIRIEASDLNNVAVYNLVGQKVYEENINGDECVINMKDFGSGIYMVKIQTVNGSTTQKVSVIE